VRRAVRRVRLAVRPLVTITDPPDGIAVDRDVEVVVRDGTVLRADVYRVAGSSGVPAPTPVLMCAHPYGKDRMPRRGRRGWRVPAQFRMLSQSEPFSVSAITSWEAPDPAFWVPRGYTVVNLDLRGWGKSEGVGVLLSDQEGRDIHDAIEWAATAPFSNGAVGLTGVSYLAIAQWAAAAERPPHLAAICPWEGFTDLYRDLARPGGIREDGFARLWTTLLKRQRRSPVTIRRDIADRPLVDDWWRARNRNLEQIDAPALVCASFSDHCLHSRGSFEGFRRISSGRRYLHTHRSPKWAAYYAGPGRDAQVRFFDHVLLGRDTGLDDAPPVRVEIRSDAATVAAVRHTTSWPPPEVTWQPFHLDAHAVAPGRLAIGDVPAAGTMSFDRRRGARFIHRFTATTDVVGPMWVRLHLGIDNGEDAHVFVGIDKMRDGKRVGFEGSYGFGDDLLTHGMRRLALRRTHVAVADRVPPWFPGQTDTTAVPLARGSVEPVDIELHASATRFEAGDELHLVMQGRWFFATDPLTGQVPARYDLGPAVTCRVHTGGEFDSVLYAPVWPRDDT
jgi:hypothetical protein